MIGPDSFLEDNHASSSSSGCDPGVDSCVRVGRWSLENQSNPRPGYPTGVAGQRTAEPGAAGPGGARMGEAGRIGTERGEAVRRPGRNVKRGIDQLWFNSFT